MRKQRICLSAAHKLSTPNGEKLRQTSAECTTAGTSLPCMATADLAYSSGSGGSIGGTSPVLPAGVSGDPRPGRVMRGRLRRLEDVLKGVVDRLGLVVVGREGERTHLELVLMSLFSFSLSVLIFRVARVGPTTDWSAEAASFHHWPSGMAVTLTTRPSGSAPPPSPACRQGPREIDGLDPPTSWNEFMVIRDAMSR